MANDFWRGDIGKFIGQAAPVVGGIVGGIYGGPAGAALGYAGGSAISQGYYQDQANDTNIQMAREANQMSQSNAREQMAFQERMSNTAHQREVADLKAAGLNPILSANAGSSTPTGASGNVTAARVDNPWSHLASSAVELGNIYTGFKQASAQVELMNAQAEKAKIETQVAKKGIPEADLKNKTYEQLKPIIDKLFNWFNSAKNSKAGGMSYGQPTYKPYTRMY